MSAWAERNPNARRAINRTLVLSDSTRPLLTPCSNVASMSARWYVMVRASATKGLIRQHRAQCSQCSSESRAYS
jgi:hypothetical protein